MSVRWRRFGSICAGRWRSTCRSTPRAFTPRAWRAIAPGSCSTAGRRLVFERSLELAAELGLIEGEAEQIVDSTAMLGTAAVQDNGDPGALGGPKAPRCGRGEHKGASEELASGPRFEYSRPREKPTGDWEDKASREALLAEVARDAVRALRAVEEDEELAAEAESAQGGEALREIVGQEFEVGATRSRVRAEVAGRGAHEPEMRHGHQTAARPFTGYIHAAAAAEAPLLTSITLSPANEHDGHQAGELVEQQPKRRRPTRLIADTAYDNVESARSSRRRSISVLAPAPNPGRTTVRSARATSEGGVSCPELRASRGSAIRSRAELLLWKGSAGARCGDPPRGGDSDAAQACAGLGFPLGPWTVEDRFYGPLTLAYRSTVRRPA
jgi:Transposase DDE domain